MFVSCASPQWISIGNKTNSIEMTINQSQLDSICLHDSLDPKGWISVPLRDYESKKAIDKSLYITDSIIYTVLKTDSCYYLEKRIDK